MAYVRKADRKPKSTALAKKGSDKVPAHLQKLGAEGTENLSSKGVKVPYIKLCHKQNRSLDLSPGDIFSSVSGENFGQDVEFVVLEQLPDVWKKFDDDNQIIGVSNNGKTWEYGDLKGEELEEEEDWRLLHRCYYILLTADAKEGKALPYMLSFTKTAKTNATKLDNLLVQETKIPKVPIYSVPFMLTSAEKSKGKLDWLVFDVAKSNNKWLDPAETEIAKAMRKAILAKADMSHNEEEVDEDDQPTKKPARLTGKKGKKTKY